MYRIYSFFLAICLNTCIGIFLLLLFSYFRRKPSLSWIYKPRTLTILNQQYSQPPRIDDTGLFNWFKQCWNIEESVLLTTAGPDAVMLSRFYIFCMKFFALCCLIGVALIVPVNLVSNNEELGRRILLHGFDTMSVNNINSDHLRNLYLHAITAWIIYLAAMYLLYKTWKGYIRIRHTFLIQNQSNNQLMSLLMHNIPKSTRSDDKFAEYCKQLFGANYSSSVLVKDCRRLSRTVEKREKILDRLEYFFGLWAETGQRPAIIVGRKWENCWLKGQKVDAIIYYARKLQKYNRLVTEIKRGGLMGGFRPIKIGFVTLNTSLAVNTLVKCEINHKPFQYQVSLAPKREDLIWPNLLFSAKIKYIRNIITTTIITVMLIFWTIPATAAQSLSNLNRLAKQLNWTFLEEFIVEFPVLTGFIQGYLPGLVVTLIMNIIPLFLYYLGYWSGQEANSSLQKYVLTRYFLFEIFNFFVIPTVTGSLSIAIKQIIDHPAEMFYLLGESIPSTANFFVSYVLVTSLTGYPFILLRLKALLIDYFYIKYWCKTVRSVKMRQMPPRCDYGSEYPEALLVFCIGITYTVISPIILPFVFLFFCLAYVANIYQLLYIFVPQFESGGLFWPTVFKRIIACLLVSQASLIGLFALKHLPVAATLCLPLPIITIIFYRFITKAYHEKGKFLPIEQAEHVDKLRAEKFQQNSQEAKQIEIEISERNNNAELLRKDEVAGDNFDPYIQPEFLVENSVQPAISEELNNRNRVLSLNTILAEYNSAASTPELLSPRSPLLAEHYNNYGGVEHNNNGVSYPGTLVRDEEDYGNV
jgi:hypothetical protein